MEISGFYRRSRPSELGGSVAKGGRSQPSAGPALARRGSPGGAGGRARGTEHCGCARRGGRAGALRGRGERSQRGGGSGWRQLRAGAECPVCTCGGAAVAARRRTFPRLPGASGPGLASVASSAPRRPFPPPRGRRVGSSGLSAGRGVLQAARTTALVAAVTTASAGGEDERVRKGEGQQAGAWRAGERGVGRRAGRALPERRDSRQDRASGRGTSPGSSITRLREGAEA